MIAIVSKVISGRLVVRILRPRLFGLAPRHARLKLGNFSAAQERAGRSISPRDRGYLVRRLSEIDPIAFPSLSTPRCMPMSPTSARSRRSSHRAHWFARVVYSLGARSRADCSLADIASAMGISAYGVREYPLALVASPP